MNDLEQKLAFIKEWLGTGSIDIFGLPMSGKDTVGLRFAELIGAKFLSSGLIIRAAEKENNKNYTGNGQLAPTDVFFDLILPYFEREDLKDFPLVLSSVGRWSGEENEIMSVAKNSGHEIKAVVLLQISEQDIMNRWEAANFLKDRGEREDDKDKATLENRMREFREKTIPVVKHYKELDLLVEVRADQYREEVLTEFINKLYDFATTHNQNS